MGRTYYPRGQNNLPVQIYSQIINESRFFILCKVCNCRQGAEGPFFRQKKALSEFVPPIGSLTPLIHIKYSLRFCAESNNFQASEKSLFVTPKSQYHFVVAARQMSSALGSSTFELEMPDYRSPKYFPRPLCADWASLRLESFLTETPSQL